MINKGELEILKKVEEGIEDLIDSVDGAESIPEEKLLFIFFEIEDVKRELLGLYGVS